jgi:hypothetical protein
MRDEITRIDFDEYCKKWYFEITSYDSAGARQAYERQCGRALSPAIYISTDEAHVAARKALSACGNRLPML